MKVALKSKGIQRHLARKNKSQNWLAFRLKISTGYMSQLMTGVRNPSPELRERILFYISSYPPLQNISSIFGTFF